MNKFSPTTLFGYLRFVVCLVIIGHVLWTMYQHGIYAINVQYSIACVALQQLTDKLLGAAESHFTADSPPAPKANA